MLNRTQTLFLLFGIFACWFRAQAQPCTGITIADADVSSQRILRIFYDNDAFNGTQRYYTHGIRAEVIHPRFKDLFLSKRLLLRIGSRAHTFYGLGVSQQAFTPLNIESRDTVSLDRPYAGSLFLSHFLISNDARRRIRLTTQLDIGLLGPLSFGRVVTANSNGWDNQVHTDLVLAYAARLEKGVIETQGVDMQLFGYANVGTLRPHAGMGGQLRIGMLNPYFYTLHFTRKTLQGSRVLKKTQFFVLLRAEGEAVAYDATLQGGLLNRSSPYRLTGSEINRLLGRFGAGLTFIHGKLGLGYEHILESKTFKAGSGHIWGRVKLFVLF